MQTADDPRKITVTIVQVPTFLSVEQAFGKVAECLSAGSQERHTSTNPRRHPTKLATSTRRFALQHGDADSPHGDLKLSAERTANTARFRYLPSTRRHRNLSISGCFRCRRRTLAGQLVSCRS
ncbi:hypothetical protein GCM10022255_107250 [Dactylosporangium darangshiense]|uniref:Uncharacterized protein n=1 Tax=Dactylosporangium darangshiense TaxID=579108 RepID=A0ABP8DUD4_9ACTN